MSFFDRLFGNSPQDPSGVPAQMPWDRHPSILEHVRSHISPDEPGLTSEGYKLPDEDRINEGQRIRFAPGAMDGVMTHHFGSGEEDEAVNRTVQTIRGYCNQPTVANKLVVYENLLDGTTLSVIDPVLEAILSEEGINHQRLYELARSFTTESPDREPVKFGVALLGLFGQPQDEEIFQTLGRHDEFTLFCAVALSNSVENSEVALWNLGRNVEGWGRIHVVERLAEAQAPEIKDWLLRKAYRNAIMVEYLAYTCATAGGLLSALSEDSVDRELLTASGELLAALIAGGPAENIDSYEDGALATELFLGHMETSAESLGDFLNVHAIKQFLEDEAADWSSRAEREWTTERRDRLRLACEQILARPEWPDRARIGLASEDEVEFYQADQAAKALGLDTWQTHWDRLRKMPTDSGRWYHVMIGCNEGRIGDVIAFAEQNIDLQAVTSGPADELGLGPEWTHHQCLGYVLQELRRFPGHGNRLIQAGLQSPVVSNRNMAIKALSAWGHSRWDADVRASLEDAARIEPKDDVREHMEKTLKGEPLEG